MTMPARQPERLRPTRRTGGRPGDPRRIAPRVQAVAQRRELRIEPREKLLRRQAAPRLRVHRLVAGGADAAHDLPRVADAGQHAPARSRPARPSSRRRRRRRAPRRGTARSSTTTTRTNTCRRSAPDTAARARRAVGGDRAPPLSADVWSFHSHACAARLALPLRVERERARLRVDRQRRRAGGVDADADHLVGARSPARGRPPPARRSPTHAGPRCSRPGSGAPGAARFASSSTPCSPLG